MAGLNVQEDSLYLPENIVRKSPGFTIDVGKSAHIHAPTLTHTYTVDVGKSARIHSLTHTHTYTEKFYISVFVHVCLCVSVSQNTYTFYNKWLLMDVKSFDA